MGVNGIGMAGWPATGYEAQRTQRKAAGKNFADFTGATESRETAADQVVNQIDYEERAFALVGANVPKEVKRAWMDAAKESGVNGFGMSGNGMLTHISQMMVQRLTNQMQGSGETNDLLGSTVQSAIRATQQALYDLDHPRAQRGVKSIDVQWQQVKERDFYRAFLDKLCALV